MRHVCIAVIIWAAVILCGILANEEHIQNELMTKSAGVERPKFHRRAHIWSYVVIAWPAITLFAGFMCWSAVLYAVDESRLNVRYHGAIAYGTIGVLYLTAWAAKEFRDWRHMRALHPNDHTAHSNDETPKDDPQEK